MLLTKTASSDSSHSEHFSRLPTFTTNTSDKKNMAHTKLKNSDKSARSCTPRKFTRREGILDRREPYTVFGRCKQSCSLSQHVFSEAAKRNKRNRKQLEALQSAFRWQPFLALFFATTIAYNLTYALECKKPWNAITDDHSNFVE